MLWIAIPASDCTAAPEFFLSGTLQPSPTCDPPGIKNQSDFVLLEGHCAFEKQPLQTRHAALSDPRPVITKKILICCFLSIIQKSSSTFWENAGEMPCGKPVRVLETHQINAREHRLRKNPELPLPAAIKKRGMRDSTGGFLEKYIEGKDRDKYLLLEEIHSPNAVVSFEIKSGALPRRRYHHPAVFFNSATERSTSVTIAYRSASF